MVYDDGSSRGGWTPLTLVWDHYLNMGGSMGYLEVDAYLHGMMTFLDADRDSVAQPVNELLDDLAMEGRDACCLAPWPFPPTIRGTQQGYAFAPHRGAVECHRRLMQTTYRDCKGSSATAIAAATRPSSRAPGTVTRPAATSRVPKSWPSAPPGR